MKDRLIVACDNLNDKSLDTLIGSLRGNADYIKIGMEAYYRYGNDLVKELKKDFKIFLDLKLHDIPNTVEKSLENLIDLKVDLLNVHAQGGYEMMKRAADIVKGSDSKLIAVTILTSLDQKDLVQLYNTNLNLSELAINLAKISKEAGCDGVVCSPMEARGVKDACGKDFLTVTPGIRFDSDKGDQKRVMTPKMAIESGSDILVIGRSITETGNPGETFNQMHKELTHEL
jgi:orotidine-5'-phosphate decarboxylase